MATRGRKGVQAEEDTTTTVTVGDIVVSSETATYTGKVESKGEIEVIAAQT